MLHVDRKDPGSSYAEVLGQPWNIFGSPASSPASPASVPPEAWVTTPSGLKYAVLQEGAGEEARPGQPALVDYTGWLADGTRFDSSLERKQPFEFLLGAGQVVRGWEEGVSGMKVGEKRKLLIPPELGYGNRGIGKIPPGATLEFEVTLLATRPAEQAAPE
ncbi:MAG: FKBP-type peptidyl-prolyl cis-trans isomerase [Armatimonadetes bacterium]|nr:FKBP-type peptidyl-prolyl cis-trans isomerase [Armatimonadota bacterium]